MGPSLDAVGTDTATEGLRWHSAPSYPKSLPDVTPKHRAKNDLIRLFSWKRPPKSG